MSELIAHSLKIDKAEKAFPTWVGLISDVTKMIFVSYLDYSKRKVI